jgi:hypothetical protein
LNIDEPLVAPPGAAIDTQLAFEDCHSLQPVMGVSGCPVTAAVEQWSYEPSTHSLLHADSGKCVNISGARYDIEAWIILYACSDAPNEKWSLIQQANSTVWTIRSDFSGLCLHALLAPPATQFAANARLTTIGNVAKLVQMPCDGSPAQQFADVDASWAQKNAPH